MGLAGETTVSVSATGAGAHRFSRGGDHRRRVVLADRQIRASGSGGDASRGKQAKDDWFRKHDW